ncbi:MAG TPA: hypothetical protein VGO59_19110 [Verrucomicrobiae bacterium]|jgi:hypothetical protein
MQILVRNAAKEIYFDGVDWNENAAQAKKFESVDQAESFCRAHGLSSALIVVKSKNDSHEVCYPAGGNARLVSRPATTLIKSIH